MIGLLFPMLMHNAHLSNKDSEREKYGEGVTEIWYIYIERYRKRKRVRERKHLAGAQPGFFHRTHACT